MHSIHSYAMVSTLSLDDLLEDLMQPIPETNEIGLVAYRLGMMAMIAAMRKELWALDEEWRELGKEKKKERLEYLLSELEG